MHGNPFHLREYQRSRIQETGERSMQNLQCPSKQNYPNTRRANADVAERHFQQEMELALTRFCEEALAGRPTRRRLANQDADMTGGSAGPSVMRHIARGCPLSGTSTSSSFWSHVEQQLCGQLFYHQLQLLCTRV